MTNKTIFQDSFLVSGIMCHSGCGNTIHSALSDLSDLKQQSLLPDDADISIDAEPQGLGTHRLYLTITTRQIAYRLKRNIVTKKFKDKVTAVHFKILENNDNDQKNKSNRVDQINILINLASILAIIILSLTFPPSLLLTIGLTALTFLTTAFTARHYIINFYHNLRKKQLANMTTSVTLGWLISVAHTLYHVISMPMMSAFSMTFMCFIMPVMLITIINGMDEMKRSLLNQTNNMQLSNMRSLFPQMSKNYQYYELSPQEQIVLAEIMDGLSTESIGSEELPLPLASLTKIQSMLREDKRSEQSKSTLTHGMLITVKQGECFPVDGYIIQGSTLVDASILTGEVRQQKQLLNFIPAGAINLESDVTIYANADPYNSAVNKLLFRSNRARQTPTAPQTSKAPAKSGNQFSNYYAALIIIGIVASILVPAVLGILTIPLLLQNITGILFAICPCTIAIAQELPKLLSVYQRHQQGILIREDDFTEHSNDIHTVVFDKTGTLTTGNSKIDSSDGISSSLWQRIYLLEKKHGAEHPLAKAIIEYSEERGIQQSILNDIDRIERDKKNRGLSAMVQGKQLHIGNQEYLRDAGIDIPATASESIKDKLSQGLTPVFIAEDNIYQGVILVKHEIRKDVLAALTRLKKEGKKLIMLTGDSQLSAFGFNQQYGNIFDSNNIYAEHSPDKKENLLHDLMHRKDIDPKGIWFVGDGLNDAPCARVVNEAGGVSAAMNANDKAAFFTDISLNGSLDYLFAHKQLNQFFKKITSQNQWLLAYGTIAFLAFIIGFSTVGIAVSPLIPLLVMVSTTLFTLFNSYRVKCSVDNALDKKTSWPRQFLASDLSIGILVSASTLLFCGLFMSILATGGLAFPAIVFTAGAIAAVSSTCILLASALFGLFTLIGITHLCLEPFTNRSVEHEVVPANSDEQVNEMLTTLDQQKYKIYLSESDSHFADKKEEHTRLNFGLYSQPSRPLAADASTIETKKQTACFI